MLNIIIVVLNSSLFAHKTQIFFLFKKKTQQQSKLNKAINFAKQASQ